MKNSRQRAERTERTERKRGSAVALAEPEPAPAVDEAEGSRVSFAVAANGKPIEPERLRSATKDRLRAAYADEEFLKAIGVKTEADEEDAALLSIISNAGYDVLSVLMLLGARRAGYTPEQAAVLAFDQHEKAALNVPTSRVIKKYIPNIGGKYRDEIILLIALTNMIGKKIVLLRETAAAATAGSTVAPAAPTTDEPPKREVTM